MNSEWRAFRLRPHDVLYFGDARPSKMGEDHYLRSIFPPFPSTLYGAIRTRRLLDEGVNLSGFGKRGDSSIKSAWDRLGTELRTELGEFGSFGSLELRGPWLEKDGKPLFPAPCDLGFVAEAPAATKEVVRYRRVANQKGHWSHSLAPLMPYRKQAEGWELIPRSEEPESAAGWFLTHEGMEAWAKGGVPGPGEFFSRDSLWLDEVRTGVGIEEKKRRAEEHNLFTFGFIRLGRDVTLGFEVRGSALEAGGALRLGGDGRTAAIEDGSPLDLPEAITGNSAFTLYFATPTLSEEGAYPPRFAVDRMRAKLGVGQCTLLAGAVKAGLPCGGFDMRVLEQKALRRAIPAGSVFQFEGDPAKLNGANLCGFEEEQFARQGFGLACVGALR